MPPSGEPPLSLQTPSDHALFYITLVQDGALPTGFLVEFERFAWAAEGAAERTRRKRAHLGNLEAAVYLHELANARTVRGGDNPSAKGVQSTVLGLCDSRTNSTARRGRGKTGKVDSGVRRHAEGDAYLHGTALVHQHEAPQRRSYCIYPPFPRPRASSFPLVVGLEPPASVPPVDRVPPGEA